MTSITRLLLDNITPYGTLTKQTYGAVNVRLNPPSAMEKRKDTIMINMKTATLSLVGAVLMAGPATAFTILNQDKRDHTLTIDRGIDETDRKIGPGETAKFDCSEGCSVRVRGSGYDRAPEMNDRLIINSRGLLLHIEELTETGSTSNPSKPGAL